MSGITNPAEEYFKDGLWGWVATAWKKLVATAGGALHVQFAGQEADVEVTQTAAADLTPGVCGWDGSAWHKLAMVWGFSERWAESVGGTKDGDGTYSKYTVAVPAGYVYVLDLIQIQNNSGARGTIGLHAKTGGVAYTFKVFTTPAQYESCLLMDKLTLGEGDQIRVTQALCLNGDVLSGVVWGYKMKIAE